jgi:LPXTG-motif cell wall-anchored protein
MKKLLMGGFTAAGLLFGTLALTTSAVDATQSDTVHHPVCEGLVKDIAPGAPTPIGGIVYVKASDEHLNYGYKAAGYIAPSPATNGHAVSHVDVCPEPAPEPAKLRLTFLQPCEPAEGTPELAEWRIRNTNYGPVEYEITLGGAGASIPLSGTVPPGDTFFTTPWGARTIKLETNPGNGSDTKAGGDSYNGQDCPVEPEVVTPKYKYTPPTCEAPGSVNFPQDQDGYEWVENAGGTYTAVPSEGFVFPEGFEATVGPFALGQLTGEQCETTTTTTKTQPPPEPTPEAAPPSQTDVAAAGPVPPAAAPAPAAAAPAAVPTQLPSTGSSSWGLALTALASLLGGLGLVKLSRRTS